MEPMRLNNTLPVFIQLVRDVPKFKLNGEVVTATDYLDIILTESGKHDLDTIRQAIRHGFSSRLCYALPNPLKPGIDVDDLNSWTDNSLLNEDYLKKEEEFKKRLFDIQPKKILSVGQMNGKSKYILIICQY